jgi:hypothetical protein
MAPLSFYFFFSFCQQANPKGVRQGNYSESNPTTTEVITTITIGAGTSNQPINNNRVGQGVSSLMSSRLFMHATHTSTTTIVTTREDRKGEMERAWWWLSLKLTMANWFLSSPKPRLGQPVLKDVVNS